MRQRVRDTRNGSNPRPREDRKLGLLKDVIEGEQSAAGEGVGFRWREHATGGRLLQIEIGPVGARESGGELSRDEKQGGEEEEK